MSEKKKQGHYVGMWMAIGIAIWSGTFIPLAIATDNIGLIGLGPAVGVIFGLIVGKAVEKDKMEKGILEPVKEEPKTPIWWLKVALLLLGIIVSIVFIVISLKGL